MEADELEMVILNNAISENDLFGAKAVIDCHPKVLDVDFGASRGETPLHIAAKFGHVAIVDELMKLVGPEYLEIWDYYGYTPLATTATHTGSIPIATCMINKNSGALTIPAQWPWLIPVTLAFFGGHNKLGLYLYSVTPLQVFKPENGSFVGPEFLRTCLRNGEFDIALHLLQRCTELLFAGDEDGNSTIANIALSLPHSLHKSQLPFLKRWAYHSIMANYDDDSKDGEDETTSGII
ncbi:uncharacterized protein LOC114728522 [Neltuma alba]|uniref:uncharacterized protein LOC114728522 n=1 Tax=Neltuma alba TaxID=207710 RepID=UPI0010A557F3|nr:uncharacterized protein LOC114728522 [Prosopis alba]